MFPAQNKWQGSSIRPKYWNVLMCATDSYCCREPEDTTNCCNDTLVLSSTTSAIGLPTRAAAAAITNTINLNFAVSSEISSSSSSSIDISDTRSRTVATIAGASNTQCASTTTEAKIRPATSSIATVGAGVGVSLGISLIASLVTLVFLMRRHKNLKKELVQARESILLSHGGSTPTPMREQRLLLAPSVRELDTPTSRVPELHTSRV